MNFACNGVITGYTVALRDLPGDQDQVIQVLRENVSQPGSYYKTCPGNSGIAIDSALCIGGLTEASSGSGGSSIYGRRGHAREILRPRPLTIDHTP